MTPEALAKYFDSTNLKLDASADDIRNLCKEAVEIGAYSVMLYPGSVALARSILEGTDVKVGTVAGFPSGRFATASKAAEIVEAAKHGAHEIDVVANYPELILGNTAFVEAELTLLSRIAHESGALLKVIVETCYLNDQQILDSLNICETAGVDFIKTSTGFGSAGAKPVHISLWNSRRQGSIKIKAAGGIRTLSDAKTLIDAGADRLGLSSASAIINELRTGEAADGEPAY
jgi:deoxyribose-phosphate aldolase